MEKVAPCRCGSGSSEAEQTRKNAPRAAQNDLYAKVIIVRYGNYTRICGSYKPFTAENAREARGITSTFLLKTTQKRAYPSDRRQKAKKVYKLA